LIYQTEAWICPTSPFISKSNLIEMKSTVTGFGVSEATSTTVAVTEAVAKASEALGGATPSVAFVASTVTGERDVDEVRKAFCEKLPSGTPIHGITSSGVVLTKQGTKPGAVGCFLVSSPSESSFVTAFHPSDGAAAVASLKTKMANPKAIFMGATPGAEEGILDCLNKEFPGVRVFGGTAADDDLSGKWMVFSEGESSGTGISLVGIGPDVPVGFSMLGPYTPTSTVVTATKTEGRRVFELDGKPAGDWVLDWVGDEVKEQYENGGLVLPQTAKNPIAIPAGDEFVTAHCAAFGGKSEGYVDFFAPVPEGSELIVMESGDGPETGYGSAFADAYDVAKAEGSLDTVTGGLLVFCGGMAIAVGENLNTGLANPDFTGKVADIPMMGMTVFGEQGCLPKKQENVQRNLSTGMVLFG